MSYQEFEEMERMHSCWSMMDKVARMAYLKGEKKQLYDLEEQYRVRHLTPQQIQQERQGGQTTKIIQKNAAAVRQTPG